MIQKISSVGDKISANLIADRQNSVMKKLLYCLMFDVQRSRRVLSWLDSSTNAEAFD